MAGKKAKDASFKRMDSAYASSKSAIKKIKNADPLNAKEEQEQEEGNASVDPANYLSKKEKKEWKKQTVNTFLTRLAQKGFLNIDKSGKRAIYIPSVSRKKYYEDYAQQIIEDSYEGSLKNFVCAFTKNHKLTSNEKEELLTYIHSL